MGNERALFYPIKSFPKPLLPPPLTQLSQLSLDNYEINDFYTGNQSSVTNIYISMIFSAKTYGDREKSVSFL